MANYLTLVEQLSTAVDQLNEVLQGDENTTVTINGQQQPSVQKKTLDEVNAKIQLVLDAAADIDAVKYATTAAGIAATTDGQFFSVVSPNDDSYLDLYKNESDIAVFQKSYPSEKLISGLHKTLGAHAYLYAGSRVLHLEEKVSPTALCVKFDGIRIELPETSSYKQFTWQDIKDAIGEPSLFIESPKGVADCLVLADKSLVYDLEEDVVTVVDRRTITGRRYRNVEHERCVDQTGWRDTRHCRETTRTLAT